MAEQIKTLIAISASLTGAIIGWMAVLKPLMGLLRERKAQRQRSIEETLKADKAYRQTVLDKLEGLGSRMTTMDDSMNFSMVKSCTRSAPSCLSYRITRPLCSRKPKRSPVTRP